MSAAALKGLGAVLPAPAGRKRRTPPPYRASPAASKSPSSSSRTGSRGNWGGVHTWDSTVVRQHAARQGKELEVGDFLTLPGAKTAACSAARCVYAVSKRSKQPELAAKFASFMLTDPEGRSAFSTSREAFQRRPSRSKSCRARPPAADRGQGVCAHLDAAGSNAITPPAPQFEHPRVQKFVREVFEAVGYGKMTPDEAAKQLNEQGSTIP